MRPAYLGRIWETFTRADGVVERRDLHAYRGRDGEVRYAATEADARAAVQQ